MSERLNFREAVARAGISRQRLNDAIKSGRLPAERGGGPGKPTYITLEDLQAWCAAEGLPMPVEAVERSERLKPEDLARFFDRFQSMVETIERLERSVEHAIERLERSQAQTVDRAVERLSERLEPTTTAHPMTEPPSTIVNGNPPEPWTRERIEAYIWHLHTQDGLGSRRLAARLQAEGVPTLTGRGQWHDGTIDHLLKRLKATS